MQLPVTRTSQAEEDLINIWLFIAQDSPSAADRMLDTIDSRLKQLSLMPRSGPRREDLASNVRHLLIGNYLAFYRLEEKGVLVLRVMHGHRNITSDDLSG